MESKKNIALAILAVMNAVKGMEKSSRVGTGRNAYNGTKDQDVKEVMNKALFDNGLCIVPIDVQAKTTVSRWVEDSWDYQAKELVPKSKQSIFVEVKTKYLLLHTSGESIELSGYGHGVDPQDKSAGKATTYALKNCLLYTFLTPVGKIDDTDTAHSQDHAQPPPKQEPKDDRKTIADATVPAVIERAIKENKSLADIQKVVRLTTHQAKEIKKGLMDNFKEMSKLADESGATIQDTY